MMKAGRPGMIRAMMRALLKPISAAAVMALCIASNSDAARATFAAENLSCDIAQPQGDDVLATCTGPAGGRPGSISIIYLGSAPNFVREVRLKWSGEDQPFQTIAVSARPLIDLETVGVLYRDMNFDGHNDLAVMRSANGNDAGYDFFLFDDESGQFTANQALNDHSWPDFDTQRKVVRTYEEPPQGGRIVNEYVWQNNGALILNLRIEWSANDAETCKQTRFSDDNDAGRIINQQPCG